MSRFSPLRVVSLLFSAALINSSGMSISQAASPAPSSPATQSVWPASDSNSLFYSNFNYKFPNDLYSDQGFGLYLPTIVAESFTAPFTGSVTEIQLPLAYFPNGLDAFYATVKIWDDNQGVPGTAIYFGSVTSYVATMGGPCCTIDSVQTLLLAPGEVTLTEGLRYWVSVEASSSKTNGTWRRNSELRIGKIATSTSSGWVISRNLRPAVAIFGSP